MKNFTWILAICAMAFASCSRDDSSAVVIPHNSDEINFETNTTRAAIVDLAALQASPTGFVVYGASGAAPASWYADITGSNNYKYGVGATKWSWASAVPQWPTTPAGYPMKFYAYYASSLAGLTVGTTTPTSLTGTFVVPAAGAQVDLLAAKAEVASKPASGTLPLTFKHALSKINFGLIPGNGATVYLQSVNANNVGDTRPYDFIAGAWTTIPAAFSSNYIYKATVVGGLALVGNDPAETVVKDIAPTNPNLMLMPQTANTWAHVSGQAPANAYMSLIYRLQTVADVNAVGYLRANDHPDYNSLALQADKDALNGKPLFVKVGYPFAAGQMTWVMGKGYTYNICLGTAGATNGYIADTLYYDENGVPTKLTIKGKTTGDPISSGDINFFVTVTDWDNQTPSVIQ